MPGVSASSTVLSRSLERSRPGWAAPLFLAAISALAACGAPGAEQQASEYQHEAAKNSACAPRDFEGSRFTVCVFYAERDVLQLRWKGKDGEALRSLQRLEEDLGREAKDVLFATNAGMFDEEGAPVGLYIAHGSEMKRLNRNKGPGNFHLMPNGVFHLSEEGKVSVETTADYGRHRKHARWATQSGPMLVIDGKLHPRFDQDGPSRLVRNGVGVKDEDTAFFVISEDAVSFGRFARFFRDVLGCSNALFLDGSVSSLWDPAAGRQDAVAPLGPMVVVLQRSPVQAQPARKQPAAVQGPARSMKE